jgi:hypothetical protein
MASLLDACCWRATSMDRATRVGQHHSMIKNTPVETHPRGKASQSVKLVLAGIMAVGTPMSAGSGDRGDRCDLSLPLEGITYGCKRLDTGGSKLPETPPVTAQIMHPFWDCNLLVKLGASSVPALNCATPPVGVLSPPIAMCAQPIAIAAQSR